MAKNNKKQIIQYVNKKGVLVTELCHDPLTCKKHNKRKRVNTGLTLSQLIASNPMLFAEEEPVEQALNKVKFSDSKKELDIYSNHEDPEVRAMVVQNLTTRAKTIAKLALDEDGIVSSVALKDYRLPNKFFRKYVEATPYVRSLLASNPSAPEKLVEAASRDSEYIVRQSAASNVKASAEVLSKLSLDRSEMIRSSVASNPSTSEKTLNELSKDDYPIVRRSVMANHNSSEFTVTNLSFDSDVTVRNAVFQNLNPNTENAKSIVSMQGGKIAKTIQDILAAKMS